MAPILWMILFIIGLFLFIIVYGIYNYNSTKNNEPIEYEKMETVYVEKITNNPHKDNTPSHSSTSWLATFLILTMLFIGFLSIVYLLANFHGM